MARVRGAPAPTLSSVVANASQTVLMKETAALDEKRDQSHERAMKNARWSIEPAERGNAGLQNAVSAATKSELLKEITWVSIEYQNVLLQLRILGRNAWDAD